MCTSAAFWAQHFRTAYVGGIEAYRTGALERILPAFRGIGEEADAAADAEFERLGAMPAAPDDQVDMADLAERADRHGQKFYEMMRRVRQGWLNLVAVGLHHLVEQQQSLFFQNALATAGNEEFRPGALNERLAEHGVDAENLGGAARVWELRTAANAIKHGPGPAARRLAELRPELFEDRGLAEYLESLGIPPTDIEGAQEQAARLGAPMAGEDLYVTENDLTEWCEAAIEYWRELATSIEALDWQERGAD